MNLRRSGALLCVLVVFSTFAVASPAHAGCGSSSELAPVLQDVTLNQGLGSYPQLVRNKDILVRFFLSRPQCADADQTVEVTSAALNVKVGPVSVATIPEPENDLDRPPIVSLFSTAKSVGTTGDPVWIVDPEDLDLVGTGAATLQFEATIGYNSSLGSGSVNLTQLRGDPISKPILPPTDPQRILAIPIAPGLGQLKDAALTETIKGFQHFGRMLPVANNTGDLVDTSVSTGGMQFFIDTSTAYVPPSNFLSSGKFCGGNNKQQTQQVATDLNAFLQQHNSANPLTKSADRVLGIVVPTKPDGTAFACTSTLGYAQVHGTSAWVVAKTDFEMTGALMGLEGGHNLGGVPCGGEIDQTKCPVDRDNDFDAFHSINLTADGSDPDRAYNLFAPLSYLSDDRSVMRFKNQAAGWLNANTLYELEDWALLLCRFGGPVTEDCTAPIESTLASAAATDVTVLSGITDETPEGTFVVDSFAEEPGGARTPPPASPLHLLQRNSEGNIVSDIPVHVQSGHSAHLEEDDHGATDFLSFSVSYESHPDAVAFQLVDASGEILYERTEFGETTGIREVQNSLEPLETGPPCPIEECPDPRAMTGPGEFGAGATAFDFENGLETPAVTFIDDANSTPQTIRQCPGEPPSDGCLFPADTDTQSPTHALWNRPQLVGVPSPLDPLPNSAGDPLAMTFTEKQRKVGMWIGNDDVAADDTPDQTVTLTAFSDSDGNDPIPGAQATLSEEDFDNNVTTFIGVDAGVNQIKRVELSYGDAILGEEIDDLTFERSTREPFVSNTWRLTTTAKHDVPSLLRAAYFAKCTDSSGEEANRVLKAGVPADETDEVTDTATWRFEFDTRLICRDGERVTLRVKINDGYTQKGFFDISVPVPGDPDTAPLAVIASPEGTSEVGDILSHENAFLFGQGWDQEDGQLPDDALTWHLAGPGISDPTASVGTGQSVQVSPQGGHPCGWTPGVYTATLEVVDSGGNVSSTSTTFEVLEDCDNDTIPAPDEECFGGDDNDNSDAVLDFDGDGVPNNQDEDPCLGLFLVTGDFEPNTLNVGSAGGSNSVTMSFQLSQRDLSEITDANKVRIVEVDGMDVTDPGVGGNQQRWFATAWSVSTKGTKTGTAKFDRQALIDFIFHEHGISGRPVTIVMEAVSSRNPIYKVHAQDQTFVQNN